MYIGKIREISQTVRIIENLRVEMPKKNPIFYSCSRPEQLMSSQEDKRNLQKSYWKNLLFLGGFGGLQLYFESYANHLFLCYE